MITNRQIKWLLSGEYNLKNFTLKDLGGHIDKVFLVKTKTKKYVLKISLNKRMTKTIFENQLKLMAYLNKNGISIPKIFNTTTGRSYSIVSDYKKRYCILYEFISGKNIVIDNKKQAIDLAKWVTKIHKLCLDFKGKPLFYYNPVEVEIYKTNYISKYIKRTHREFTLPMLSQRKKIVAAYQKNVGKLRSGIFINDLAQSNIVIKNGKKYILDFNIAGGNYLVDDLSWILSWYFLETGKKGLAKDFIKIYQHQIKLNDAEKKILKVLPILYSNLQYKHFAAKEKIIPGVSITRLKRKQFSLFYKWWNDPVLRQLTSEVKGKMPEEEIDKILEKHLVNKSGYDFIITADRQPVGHILIQKKKSKKYFEIYIAIGEKLFWNKGVGTASMDKACKWFFNNFKNEKALDLEVLINNARAIRAYEKVGFKRIRIIHNKKSTDTILMRKFK